MASDDTTAPQLDVSSSYPTNAATVDTLQGIRLAFSEPVVALADCVGGIMVVGSTANTTYPCADGSYYITIDSGALADLAGNILTYVTTTSSYTWTVTASTATTPELLYSTPLDGGAFDGNLINNVSMIALDYSIAVTGTASFLELEDC